MSVCPERLGGGLQIRYMQVRSLSPTPGSPRAIPLPVSNESGDEPGVSPIR